MTLEERAACIADTADGSARGVERRRRIYNKALKMLTELKDEMERKSHGPTSR